MLWATAQNEIRIWIPWQIPNQIRNSIRVWNRGPGGAFWWKKKDVKNLVGLPFKFLWLPFFHSSVSFLYFYCGKSSLSWNKWQFVRKVFTYHQFKSSTPVVVLSWSFQKYTPITGERESTVEPRSVLYRNISTNPHPSRWPTFSTPRSLPSAPARSSPCCTGSPLALSTPPTR